MSLPEVPAETEAKQILHAVEQLNQRLDSFATAINGLGQNTQWLVDNAQQVFQVFMNPAFMSALPSMMNPEAMAKMAGGADSE